MDHGRAHRRLDSWLRAACDDAERRGLPALKPLLETLARSTAALREADRAVHDAALVPGTLELEYPAVGARRHAESTE
jgi:hypothetical protein